MPGCCLVVSPLVALMQDQVKSLREKGVAAGYLHAGLDRKNVQKEVDSMLQGRYKLFYVAPERLLNREFQLALSNSKISFLAVDEAHCISQWGFNFRPSYRNIKVIKERNPNIKTMALTASATPVVVKDINEQLELDKPLIIRKSFKRPNLSYQVKYSDDKIERIIREVKESEGSCLIYVRNRRLTMEIARIFQNNDVKALAYHAGKKFEERQKIQNSWMQGETKLVVATNAFGMGIDKGDVRLVIHYLMPDSLESYYQEAGRAGRDGLESKCVIFFTDLDAKEAKAQLKKQYPSLDFLKVIYEAISNFLLIPLHSGMGVSHKFQLADFSKKFGHNGVQVFHAIKLLERMGYWSLSDYAESSSRVQILLDSRQLYSFQVKFEKYDGLLKMLTRHYGGINTTPAIIDEFIIAKKLGLNKDKVISLLHDLEKIEIVSYEEGSNEPRLLYLRDRVDQITDPDNFIRSNFKRSNDRLKGMIDYLTQEKCRMQLISDYFGEAVEEVCGKCDICRLNAELGRNYKAEGLADRIKSSLDLEPKDLKELKRDLQNEDKQLDDLVRYLISEEKIRIDQGKKLHWI